MDQEADAAAYARHALAAAARASAEGAPAARLAAAFCDAHPFRASTEHFFWRLDMACAAAERAPADWLAARSADDVVALLAAAGAAGGGRAAGARLAPAAPPPGAPLPGRPPA